MQEGLGVAKSKLRGASRSQNRTSGELQGRSRWKKKQQLFFFVYTSSKGHKEQKRQRKSSNKNQWKLMNKSGQSPTRRPARRRIRNLARSGSDEREVLRVARNPLRKKGFPVLRTSTKGRLHQSFIRAGEYHEVIHRRVGHLKVCREHSQHSSNGSDEALMNLQSLTDLQMALMKLCWSSDGMPAFPAFFKCAYESSNALAYRIGSD